MTTDPIEERTDRDPPTARIAQWVASLPARRTRPVQALATDGIRDLVGCMLGGSVEPTARQAASVAIRWGNGASTIVGQSARVSAPASAFANGTSAHALDFDDSFAPLTGHPSAVLVPALLALAEEQGCPGAAVLDAYVVGLEVIAAVGRAVNPSHYMIGWHSTASVGVIGAAAACARLLGLDAEGVQAAMSIAVSCSSGTRAQIGFSMKSIQAGLAAHDAVIAATLAAQGIRGNPEPLASARGFLELYSERSAEPESFVMPGGNDALAIENPGITFKPYPTCGSTHRSLDALLDLREKHQFAADEVEAVDLVVPYLNAKNLIYDSPQTGMEARFSMQYCAALAIVQGALRLGDFEDKALLRPSIRALMQRVQMHVLPGSHEGSKDYLEYPAHTEVRLRSGTVLQDTRKTRRGSLSAPMSAADQSAKFMDCGTRLLDGPKCEQVLALLSALAVSPSVDELMAALRTAPGKEVKV